MTGEAILFLALEGLIVFKKKVLRMNF